jgi:hypothetical protein
MVRNSEILRIYFYIEPFEKGLGVRRCCRYGCRCWRDKVAGAEFASTPTTRCPLPPVWYVDENEG